MPLEMVRQPRPDLQSRVGDAEAAPRQAAGVWSRRRSRGPELARTNRVLSPQPSDFSASLKAAGKNKHFRVQLVDDVYCIGQRRFHTMDELVEHYRKAPIFTSEHGEKLYLVRALQ